jgi:hypothetical protein
VCPNTRSEDITASISNNFNFGRKRIKEECHRRELNIFITRGENKRNKIKIPKKKIITKKRELATCSHFHQKVREVKLTQVQYQYLHDHLQVTVLTLSKYVNAADD